jgi:hypothetical protein
VISIGSGIQHFAIGSSINSVPTPSQSSITPPKRISATSSATATRSQLVGGIITGVGIESDAITSIWGIPQGLESNHWTAEY